MSRTWHITMYVWQIAMTINYIFQMIYGNLKHDRDMVKDLCKIWHRCDIWSQSSCGFMNFVRCFIQVSTKCYLTVNHIVHLSLPLSFWQEIIPFLSNHIIIHQIGYWKFSTVLLISKYIYILNSEVLQWVMFCLFSPVWFLICTTNNNC